MNLARGEFQKVDEVFQRAGHAAVVFGRDHMETGGVENGLTIREQSRRGRFVGGGREGVGREVEQIEQLRGHTEFAVGGLDMAGDFAGVAAGPVGAAENDDSFHTGKSNVCGSREVNDGMARDGSPVAACAGGVAVDLISVSLSGGECLRSAGL